MKKSILFIVALSLFMMLGTAQVLSYQPDDILTVSEVFLDGERDHVRTGETNLGNLVADVIKYFGDEAEVGLMNSGSIRTSLEEGPITVRDVLTLYTFNNWIVTLEVTGDELWQTLENSVRSYPDSSGGFLQVSGLSFTFDPSKPAGERVVEVYVGDMELDLEASYIVATTNFVARGGDGYTMLGDIPISRMQNLYAWEFNRVDNAIIAYLDGLESVAPEVEGRIKMTE